MFFLMRMNLKYGERMRCSITHFRAGEANSQDAEVIERVTIPEPEGTDARDRGWVVPANPQSGDSIVFELDDVWPVGPGGAEYEWEARLCDANGPGRFPNPEIFRVLVPEQLGEDIEACPGARIDGFRAFKEGPRRFRWVIDEKAA